MNSPLPGFTIGVHFLVIFVREVTISLNAFYEKLKKLISNPRTGKVRVLFAILILLLLLPFIAIEYIVIFIGSKKIGVRIFSALIVLAIFLPVILAWYYITSLAVTSDMSNFKLIKSFVASASNWH